MDLEWHCCQVPLFGMGQEAVPFITEGSATVSHCDISTMCSLGDQNWVLRHFVRALKEAATKKCARSLMLAGSSFCQLGCVLCSVLISSPKLWYSGSKTEYNSAFGYAAELKRHRSQH